MSPSAASPAHGIVRSKTRDKLHGCSLDTRGLHQITIEEYNSMGNQSQLKIPGLQREALRACVTCGAAADAYCARCGVTPYCSVRCQRRDWTDRHSAVCHNLARMITVPDVDEPVEVEVNIPPPAPLRRPRSPPREPAKSDKNDTGSDRGSKKFIPPGHHPVPNSGQVGRGGGRTDYQTDKPHRAANNQDKPHRAANQDKPNRANNQDKPNRANNQDTPNKADIQDRLKRTYNQDSPNRAENQDKPNSKSYRQPGLVDNGSVFLRRPQVAKNDEVEGLGLRGRHQLQRSIHNDYYEKSRSGQVNVAGQSREDTHATKPDIKSTPESQTIPAKKETPLSQAVKEEPSLQTVKASPANKKEAAATNAKPPGSASDVTPTRKLVPKNCLIDVLSKGDSILVSVEGTEEDSRSPGKGFVCTFLSEKFTDEYSALCEDYAVACEADSAPYTPSPGDSFSVYNPDDESWYRARCLSPSEHALLDCGKVLAPGKASKVRSVRLPAAYEHAPEFSGVLQAAVKVGATLKCVLKEKSANGWAVEMFSTAGEESLGRGEVSRWLPTVQYSAAVEIPEVPRPGVSNNSAVWLVEVTDRNNVFVRASDADSQRAFDAVLHDAALAGLHGAPLAAPPAAGSYVVSKFTDGLHYRALVKRTSVKLNKYLLEYVEFGNCEVNQLENLCRCPENLLPSEAPTMTSRVALRGVTSEHPLTPAAKQYLDTLKDDSVQLVLTIPDISHSAPSGTEVVLTVESNKENVNKKVEELCTPEWLKIQRRGGDVVETQPIMYSELQFVELSAGPLVVLEFSALAGGSLSACRADRPQLFTELDALTDRMTAYCESELGREPYLPKVEELCIAQMPPYTQWYRAVLAEQVSGPGGAEAEVCYVDYGNMARVPVSLLRKMLPEFATMPAIANTIEIIDFPKEPTGDMVMRALQHLEVDEEEGRGKLAVTACEQTGPGWYRVRAPALLAAMRQPLM